MEILKQAYDACKGNDRLFKIALMRSNIAASDTEADHIITLFKAALIIDDKNKISSFSVPQK